jgi:phosphonate transport system permease protein
MAIESQVNSTNPLQLSAQDLRARLLSPWPRPTITTIVGGVILLAVLIWSFQGTRFSVIELGNGMPQMGEFLIRLVGLEINDGVISCPATRPCGPQFDIVATPIDVPAVVQPLVGAETFDLSLPRVVPYLIETLQMAVVGTLLAIILSLPFGLLAARNTTPHPWAYGITRFLLNVNRSIPDIIFALIFVAAVGLGPFGGVLALALGSLGSLAKLYAEAIEAIDPAQVQAVRATGADQIETFAYGVAPQAMPLVISYSLLLFEHNVRSATILGLVGAGGVGFILSKYISLFQYANLMGALVMIVLMVIMIDRLSDWLRKKII